MNAKTDLSKYNNAWYKPGSLLMRSLWYVTNIFFIKNQLVTSSLFKVLILRLFGAKIGKNTVIKPGVYVKYPWLLEIKDYVWLGEHAWIDNLTKVTIGSNVCISQGAYILTGNHNYTKSTFDLMVQSVVLEEGVWIGAKATVCPGITCESHSVLTAGSVATGNLKPFGIYQGNPATWIRERNIDPEKK